MCVSRVEVLLEIVYVGSPPYLVEVESKEENAFIRATVAACEGSPHWLGGSDTLHRLKFFFVCCTAVELSPIPTGLQGNLIITKIRTIVFLHGLIANRLIGIVLSLLSSFVRLTDFHTYRKLIFEITM